MGSIGPIVTIKSRWIAGEGKSRPRDRKSALIDPVHWVVGRVHEALRRVVGSRTSAMGCTTSQLNVTRGRDRALVWALEACGPQDCDRSAGTCGASRPAIATGSRGSHPSEPFRSTPDRCSSDQPGEWRYIWSRRHQSRRSRRSPQGRQARRTPDTTPRGAAGRAQGSALDETPVRRFPSEVPRHTVRSTDRTRRGAECSPFLRIRPTLQRPVLRLGRRR